MRTVTYEEYCKDLNSFVDKHSRKYDFKVYTSPFENNQYRKTVCFEDGSVFTEINEMDVVEDVEVEVHGLKIKTEVHLIRHEYWSTDDSSSKYWYEKR